MKVQVTETVTIAQAKTALEQTVRLYFSKNKNGGYRMDRRRARPVCLMGPAGIGKTEIVRQVAQEQGLAFLSYSVTHHTRQSAIGLPRLIQRELDGKAVSMTEYTMSEIIAEVYRVMQETGRWPRNRGWRFSPTPSPTTPGKAPSACPGSSSGSWTAGRCP